MTINQPMKNDISLVDSKLEDLKFNLMSLWINESDPEKVRELNLLVNSVKDIQQLLFEFRRDSRQC